MNTSTMRPLPTHWSYSSLSLYDQCPAAWAAHYRYGEPGRPTRAMRAGTDLHAAFELYGAHCYQRGLTSDLDRLRSIADGYPPESRAAILRLGENWAWEWGTVVYPDGMSPVEFALEERLPNGMTFRGRIDLLQCYEGSASPFGEAEEDADLDLWRITDFKLGNPKAYMSSMVPEQLTEYAWLVQTHWPRAQHFELRYACAAPGPAVPAWFVEGDLSSIGHQIVARIERIMADQEYEPTPGNCGWCPYEASCPIRDTDTVRSQRELAAMTDEELAGAANRTQTRYYIMRDELQRRAECGAELTTPNGARWGYETSQKYIARDPVALRELLEKQNVPLTDVFGTSLPKAKVEKLLRSGQVPGLEELVELVPDTTKFMLRKPKRAVLDTDAFLAMMAGSDEEGE